MVMTGEFEVSNELSTVLSTDLDIFFSKHVNGDLKAADHNKVDI